jgi:Domain of unknown function (DUF5602)
LGIIAWTNFQPFFTIKFTIMKIQTILKSTLFLLTIVVAFSACDKKDPWAGTFTGQESAFGSGKAHTYIVNDDDGNPIEIGIAMDEAAFDNFNNMSGDAEASLDYPEEAGKTPFKHQFMGFAAHGHEPAMIYDVPHFDFHFYTSTQAERQGITPFDTVQAARLPSADYFPPAYFETGLVPTMGVHWIDPTSPEFNGTSFTQTFIWGSFDNKVTFLEPMITKQFMVDNHEMLTDLKLPAKYDQPGKYYPTQYGFRHDTKAGEYQVFLSNFVAR